MRTDTSTSSSFTLVRRPAVFVLPTPEVLTTPGPRYVSIVLPQGSKWTPGPHWHERYVEIFRVLEGRARVVVDGKAKVVTPEDGDQRIERFQVHEFMRADRMEKGDGDEGDVVVQEWVEPADGLKEVFFRNLFSSFRDDAGKSGLIKMLQVVIIMNTYDNFDVLVEGKLSWWITHAVWSTATVLAKIIGIRSWYEEYTPERLRKVAISGGEVKQKIL